MSTRNIALVSIAGSVLSFFLGLYGAVGDWSFVLSAIGLPAVIVAVAAFVLASRPLAPTWPHPGAVLAASLAAALHAYEQLAATSGHPALGFFLWAMTPYALCLALSAFVPTRAPAVAGGAAALAFDLFTSYSVATSTSSTASLAFVFAPLWNILSWVPLFTYVAWLVLRARRVIPQTAD